jgi:hypothetical protein
MYAIPLAAVLEFLRAKHNGYGDALRLSAMS